MVQTFLFISYHVQLNYAQLQTFKVLMLHIMSVLELEQSHLLITLGNREGLVCKQNYKPLYRHRAKGLTCEQSSFRFSSWTSWLVAFSQS